VYLGEEDLKGRKNWGNDRGISEVLGAATAGSKPVLDLGCGDPWRTCGQTGKTGSSINTLPLVSPEPKFNILSSVSASKVKVVINTTLKAPFFKAPTTVNW